MAADEGPRETLLRDMKYERLGRTLNYRHLYRAIPSFLTSPTRDRGILVRCRMALEHERESAMSPQQRENLTYEIRALEAFEGSLNALGMAGLNFERVAAAAPVKIGAVSISVQPSAHIRVKRPRGVDLIGAVVIDPAKGVVPKTDAAKLKVKDGMLHAAIMIHQYVSREFPEEDPRPSPEHCIVFHTFTQAKMCAPDGYQRIMRNIEAVCRGIERDWGDIQPPPSFDPKSVMYR
jgi:hypothetical protein